MQRIDVWEQLALSCTNTILKEICHCPSSCVEKINRYVMEYFEYQKLGGTLPVLDCKYVYVKSEINEYLEHRMKKKLVEEQNRIAKEERRRSKNDW